MNLSIWCFALTLLVLSTESYAGVSFERGGQHRGYGAREAAMAGPHSADLESAQANPGIFGLLRKSSLGISNSVGILDRSAQSMSTNLVFGLAGTIGLTGSLDSFGEFDRRNEYGALDGTYKANQQSFGIGYGVGSNGFGFGFKLDWVQEKIDSSSSAQTFIALGMAANKIGITFGLNLLIQRVSRQGFGDISFGLGRRFKMKKFVFTPLISMDVRQKGSGLARAGVEFFFAEIITLRAGFETTAFEGLGIARGLRAGIGFEKGGMVLDYALEPQGSLGTEHRVSLGYRFGSLIWIPDPSEQALELFEISKEQKSQGFSGQAIISLQKAVAKDPNLVQAWHALGTILYETGNHQPALEAFNEYLELKPDDQSVHTWLKSLRAQNRMKGSLQLLRDAVYRNSSDAQAWHELGTALFKAGDQRGAYKAYSKYTELNPNDETMRQWLKTNSPKPAK